MPDQDAVFLKAVDFLNNGGELPQQVSNRFIAACLKQVHAEAMVAKKASDAHEHRLLKLEQWQGWLKIGGFGAGATSITAILLELLK